MSRTGPFQIGVLGLGNLMHTDDALGVLAVRKLAEDTRMPHGIGIIEGGTLGLDLLHVIHGISHLLVLDAVDTGAASGTLLRFEGQELANLPTSKSVHLLGLSDLVTALRLMDAAPVEVVLLGVQPESTDWGTVLTPGVDAALDGLVEATLKQVTHWVDQVPTFMAQTVPVLGVQ